MHISTLLLSTKHNNADIELLFCGFNCKNFNTQMKELTFLIHVFVSFFFCFNRQITIIISLFHLSNQRIIYYADVTVGYGWNWINGGDEFEEWQTMACHLSNDKFHC